MLTVVGFYDNYDEASQAVRDLENSGVDTEQISIVAPEKNQAEHDAVGAGEGAATGAVTGGTIGLMAGIGALLIPGVGPVIAAGTIATALGLTAVGAGVGAATGGLLGALIKSGFSKDDAEFYAEGIKRGGTLVYVAVEPAREEQVRQILQNAGSVDMDTRRQAWKSEGWTQYEEIEYKRDRRYENDPDTSMVHPDSEDREYVKDRLYPDDPQNIKERTISGDPLLRNPPLV